MTRHFYIATMPRSGSAWLANLFNIAPTICTAMHEPIRQSWKAGHEIEWPEGDYPHGVVGCDLALWPSSVPPEAPLVVVDREDDAVERSLYRLGVPMVGKLVQECRRGINKLERRKSALVVHYDDLFDPAVLDRIQNRLGVFVDDSRVRWLLGVNVQADIWSRHYQHGPGFESFLESRLINGCDE